MYYLCIYKHKKIHISIRCAENKLQLKQAIYRQAATPWILIKWPGPILTADKIRIRFFQRIIGYHELRQNFSDVLISAILPLPRYMTECIRHDIKQGLSIEAALRKHPLIFNSHCLQWLELALKHGQFISCLKIYLKQCIYREEAKKKFKAELSYPLSLVITAIALLLIYQFYFKKQFQYFFQQLGVAHIAEHHNIAPWFFVLAVLSIYALIHPQKIPLIRRMYELYDWWSWSGSMSLYLQSGQRFIDALSLSLEQANNRPVFAQLRQIQTALYQGKKYSELDLKHLDWNIQDALISIGIKGEDAEIFVRLEQQLAEELIQYTQFLQKICQPLFLVLISIIIIKIMSLFYEPLLHFEHVF